VPAAGAMGGLNRAASLQLVILVFLLAYTPQDVSARRGKGMKRTRSKTAMTLNTGKFLDKDSHNYYNHKDVSQVSNSALPDFGIL